jgi:hypothetical protein
MTRSEQELVTDASRQHPDAVRLSNAQRHLRGGGVKNAHHRSGVIEK